MKAILGVLLCYVFFASQCFALKGGPPYPGGQISTTGTFAAVMTPDPQKSPGANSIGLFSIQFPTTGLGNGVLVIFQTGETYTGTVQGLTDPDSAVFSALLNASFPFVIISTTTDKDGNITQTPINVIAVASGRLNGKIEANQSQFSSANARITGTADVQFSTSVNNIDSEIVYDVFGFRQSAI